MLRCQHLLHVVRKNPVRGEKYRNSAKRQFKMGVTKPKINTWYLNFSEIWSSLLTVIEIFEILVTWSVNVCVREVKPLSPSLDLGVDRLKFAEAFECVIILCFWNPLTVMVHFHLYHVYISFYLPLHCIVLKYLILARQYFLGFNFCHFERRN